MLYEYIEFLEKKKKSKATYINMRYKWKNLDNWIPQFLCVRFENGKKFLREFYNTELGVCFKILQRKGCHDCPFREKRHIADFTIGDYHGADEKSKVFNHLGTSVVVLNSNKSKELWDSFDKSLTVESSITKEDVYRNNRVGKNVNCEVLRWKISQVNSVSAIRQMLSVKEKIKMEMPVMFLRKIAMWWRKRKNGCSVARWNRNN
jgi:hypothetical protein